MKHEEATIKQITTKLSTNYTFLLQEGKMIGITVEEPDSVQTYYFHPKENEPKVTEDIYKSAMKTLIGTNPAYFDIIASCIHPADTNVTVDQRAKISEEVFKEHWNMLYNLVIADFVFKREISLDNLDAQYDFFKE